MLNKLKAVNSLKKSQTDLIKLLMDNQELLAYLEDESKPVNVRFAELCKAYLEKHEKGKS